MLLRRVAKERLYRLRGYAGLERYAAERLGLSPRKAWALLRIQRASRRCPALLRAYRDGRISWVQAQALVAIAERTPAHAEAWIACAGRVTVRRLHDDGEDDADDNRITLCAWHHQRGVHNDRVVRVVGRARTRFELGVRPDRPPLAVYAKGDLLLSGSPVRALSPCAAERRCAPPGAGGS